MNTVNVTEFRKHLPSYLKRVAAGEEIGITSHGRVIARLLPEKDAAQESRLWLERLRGKVILGDVVSSLEELS
ncbi:MAG: type II toxin-antitoxin system Phd/YefM family antitoxin [Leptospirales bacterium]